MRIAVLTLAGDGDHVDGLFCTRLRLSARRMRNQRSRVLLSPQAKTKAIVANIATTAIATMMLSTGITTSIINGSFISPSNRRRVDLNQRQ